MRWVWRSFRAQWSNRALSLLLITTICAAGLIWQNKPTLTFFLHTLTPAHLVWLIVCAVCSLKWSFRINDWTLVADRARLPQAMPRLLPGYGLANLILAIPLAAGSLMHGSAYPAEFLVTSLLLANIALLNLRFPVRVLCGVIATGVAFVALHKLGMVDHLIDLWIAIRLRSDTQALVFVLLSMMVWQLYRVRGFSDVRNQLAAPGRIANAHPYPAVWADAYNDDDADASDDNLALLANRFELLNLAPPRWQGWPTLMLISFVISALFSSAMLYAGWRDQLFMLTTLPGSFACIVSIGAWVTPIDTHANTFVRALALMPGSPRGSLLAQALHRRALAIMMLAGLFTLACGLGTLAAWRIFASNMDNFGWRFALPAWVLAVNLVCYIPYCIQLRTGIRALHIIVISAFCPGLLALAWTSDLTKFGGASALGILACVFAATCVYKIAGAWQPTSQRRLLNYLSIDEK